MCCVDDLDDDICGAYLVRYAITQFVEIQLTQEKNDLREEKASLKSDIDNLNVQYQQRVRAMFPWAAIDHSVVIAPPSYPYPMAMPMPPGPIPMHPSMQPYPFYGNQNPGVIPNPCSTFVPYVTANTLVEQQSTQNVSQLVHPGNPSPILGKQDSRNKSSGESKIEKKKDSNDVTTELELKTPGSTEDQVSCGLSNLIVSIGEIITSRVKHISYKCYFLTEFDIGKKKV